MMPLFFFVCGGLTGLAVCRYIRRFIPNLLSEIHALYIEIYPIKPPHFEPHKAALQPKKCGGFSVYFLIFGILFCLCYLFCGQWPAGLWLACVCAVLVTVSIIDWLYQLISPALCQVLFWLGVAAARLDINRLSVAESLQSAVIFFVVFYLIYQLARRCYRQEALGRGDYWLMFGIGSLLPWQSLPLMLFIACLSGLLYACGLKCKGRSVRTLPFAPFLSLGACSLLLLNLSGGGIIDACFN